MAKKEKLRAAASAKQQKMRAAHAHASKDGLPLGQTAAKRWIVLDLGLRPKPGTYSLDPAQWKLVVRGGAGSEHAALTLAEIQSLGAKCFEEHTWHCVTGWSALGLQFEGVPLEAILAHPKVRTALGGRQWTWLFQRAADGYTAPVCREDTEGAFFAWAHDGQPLTMEHGGPRIVFPRLFGWKSAKWLTELQLLDEYRKGFWEKCGCHPRGRVAQNERFREGWSAFVWEWLAAAPGVYRRVGGHDVWVSVMQYGGNLLGAFVSRFTTLHDS